MGNSLAGNFSVTTVGPTQADKIKDDVATPARNRHLFECWAGFGSGSVGAVAGAFRVVTWITYNDLSISGCTLWTRRDERCLKRQQGGHVSGQTFPGGANGVHALDGAVGAAFLRHFLN